MTRAERTARNRAIREQDEAEARAAAANRLKLESDILSARRAGAANFLDLCAAYVRLMTCPQSGYSGERYLSALLAR